MAATDLHLLRQIHLIPFGRLKSHSLYQLLIQIIGDLTEIPSPLHVF